MAKRNAPQSLQGLVEQITGQLTELITAEVERRVRESLKGIRAAAPSLSKHGRLCPVPGCGKPGKGPRNRYFCSEHAKSLSLDEQRALLAKQKKSEKVAVLKAGPKVVVLPPRLQRARRSLDMTCRVEGCTNRSRGPRAGFICDTHRAQLSADEQKAAREQWNARKKGEAPVSAPPPTPLAAVPPIVRKAEAAAAPVAATE
ncbi:MAG: hypothetical protein JST92_26475 [Deltaproteobacteria bacterium]|nr:hypothetical protein [Deltaproteobacteria bacterium]